MIPFNPSPGGTLAVTNATSATTPALLPNGCDTVVLYNGSATAVAYFRCSILFAQSDTGASATIPVAGGANGDFPIPPLSQIRITVGAGNKKFSVIASAADGTLFITPGTGN